MKLTRRLASRARTVAQLCAHLTRRHRFSPPLVLTLLLAALLLLLTGGLSFVAPFLYTIF